MKKENMEESLLSTKMNALLLDLLISIDPSFVYCENIEIAVKEAKVIIEKMKKEQNN